MKEVIITIITIIIIIIIIITIIIAVKCNLTELKTKSIRVL